MAKGFSLKILPLVWKGQKKALELAGLHNSTPPKRCPRRRSLERLILFLYLDGTAPLSDTAMRQLLEKLAEVYYQTEGSTTSALRNVADVLNKYLLDRNYRAASRGLKAVGYLTQIVLRGDNLFYAQSGPSYIYRLGMDSLDDYHDPELSGAGLGLGKSYKVRYHQLTLEPNQLLLFSPSSPQTWSENLLKNLPRMQRTAVIERLLHKVEDDLEAVLIWPEAGPMGVEQLTPGQLDQPLARPRPEDPAAPEPSQPPPFVIPADEPGEVPPDPDSQPRDLPEIREQPPRRPAQAAKPGLASRVADQVGPALKGIRDSSAWTAAKKGFSGIGRTIKIGSQKLLGLVSQMLPDDQLLDLPSWGLGLIAVLVPVVMVILGSVIYIRRGRNQLYAEHLSQAQNLLSAAQGQEDAGEYYLLISQAMDEAEAARSYQETEEVEGIFQSLRQELDALDRVTRLDYEPLFSRGLGPDVTITKIVVTAWNDLYLLNADQGTVIWAQSNPDGYRIIDNFRCGPIEGHITVGPLVDIVALPTSQEDQATLLGIDSKHTMIFCYADLNESPVIFEDTSYTLGRGPVEAVTIANSAPYNLFILDPEKRAVWIEYESQNYHEGSEYFGAVDSPEMADAVELETSGSELFILHSEGYLTKCVSDQADTDPICTTPFEFADPRPGRESGPFFSGANFDSFTIKGSPGVALYLLDAEDQALYRFSTQLEFQEQFRPADGLISRPATAFAVTMSDRVFLAVDDQVYTAQLIP